MKVNLSKGGSTQSPRDEEMAQCVSARQKTQQTRLWLIVQQTRVFLSLCPGKLCGTFWLQQSNYQRFAHFPLMNQLNETSVSVGGEKVCHSAV